MAESGDLSAVQSIVLDHPDLVDQANSHGNTPLRRAIANGHLDVAQWLVSEGADPNQRNGAGWSLMSVAAFTGNKNAIYWLESLGLPITELELSCMDELNELKRWNQRKGPVGQLCDIRQQNAIHYAARTGALRTLAYLMDEIGELENLDKNGHTPLAIAVTSNQYEATEMLLQAKANPDALADHYGGTVLHVAIKRKNESLVKLLLEYSSDPNQQNQAGKSVLHESISSGTKTIFELILAQPNIDLSLKTRKTPQSKGGETPLEFAFNRKKASFVRAIEDRLKRKPEVLVLRESE